MTTLFPACQSTKASGRKKQVMARPETAAGKRNRPPGPLLSCPVSSIAPTRPIRQESGKARHVGPDCALSRLMPLKDQVRLGAAGTPG